MKQINQIYDRENFSFLFVPILVLSGCVLFNFFLCFLNTSYFLISTQLIIFCEIILVGLSLTYSVRRIDDLKLYWLLIIFIIFFLIITLSLLRSEFLLKPLRDFLLIPIFIILGMSSTKLNLTKYLLILSSFVMGIALIEAYYPDQFLQVWDFKKYYINKGVMEDEEWFVLNTFASGVRPQGRFLFDFITFHRISSVFLEPVSLGFFAFIVAAYFISSKNEITKPVYIYGLVLSFGLIWLSDARMALSCALIAICFRFLFRRLDHKFAIFVIPVFFLCSWLINANEILSTTGEGFGARLRWTFELLSSLNFDIFLGAQGFGRGSPDSALGEILNNTGFLGVLLFWLAPILCVKKLPERPRVYLFAISFFLAFGLMISSAIFTIKTAALLWFIYGYLIASDIRKATRAIPNTNGQ